MLSLISKAPGIQLVLNKIVVHEWLRIVDGEKRRNKGWQAQPGQVSWRYSGYYVLFWCYRNYGVLYLHSGHKYPIKPTVS